MPTSAHSSLALLFGIVLLCSCSDGSVTPKIDRKVDGVEGFDLVFIDPDAKAEFGLLGPGYAIKANYGYFTYRSKIYRSVGGGSVLILPIANSPAKFIVRETVQSKDERGYVKTSLLQILDKATGEELARRGLVAHAVEDGTGWTGDHAVKFIRKVLKSKQAPGRPWGIVNYEPATAKVELSKSTDSPPYPAQVTPSNCPEELRIERRPNGSTVRGPGFDFRPYHPLKLIACDSGRVLVASGVYASDLHLDLLNYDGGHIAQGYVHLPLPIEASWSGMPEPDLAVEPIKVTLLVNSRIDWKSPSSSYGKLRVNAKLKCRKADCTSESLR